MLPVPFEPPSTRKLKYTCVEDVICTVKLPVVDRFVPDIAPFEEKVLGEELQ